MGKSQSDNNLLKFLRILLRNDMLIEEKQRILKEDFDYNISKNIEKEVIDMCNLSMGIYELLYTDTPDIVAINEAVELSKKYSDDKVKNMINGVLDKVYHEKLN